MQFLRPALRVCLWGLALYVLGTSAARVQAGCTYEGAKRSWHADGTGYFEQLGLHGALDSGFDDPGSLPPRKPCDGPACSNGQRPPVIPPATVSATPQTWACWTLQTCLPGAAAHPLTHDDVTVRSTLLLESIFHPPRVVA